MQKWERKRKDRYVRGKEGRKATRSGIFLGGGGGTCAQMGDSRCIEHVETRGKGFRGALGFGVHFKANSAVERTHLKSAEPLGRCRDLRRTCPVDQTDGYGGDADGGWVILAKRPTTKRRGARKNWTKTPVALIKTHPRWG